MTVFRCATKSHSHSMWLLTHHQQLAVEHLAPSSATASVHYWNKGNRFRCKRAHRTEIVFRKFSFESKFCEQNIRSMMVVHSLVSSLRKLIVAMNGKGNSHRLHAPASELMCHKLRFHRSHHSCELCVNMTFSFRMGESPHNFVLRNNMVANVLTKVPPTDECSAVQCLHQTTNAFNNSL